MRPDDEVNQLSRALLARFEIMNRLSRLGFDHNSNMAPKREMFQKQFLARTSTTDFP
jgi:hypothetical protein